VVGWWWIKEVGALSLKQIWVPDGMVVAAGIQVKWNQIVFMLIIFCFLSF
jgi:hypothetical protein